MIDLLDRVDAGDSIEEVAKDFGCGRESLELLVELREAVRCTWSERNLIRDAADVLDALWDLEAATGRKDDRGGAEYRRIALGRKLRALLGENYEA